MKKNASVEKKPKASTVKLVSYSMKMVIPTAQYSNVQPEITVKASNPEEAHDYIAKHMNRLWKEYYMVGERKIEVPKTNETSAPTVAAEQSPASRASFIKATNAIASCMSVEALTLIENQINASVKLDETEKNELKPAVETKRTELNGKTDTTN